MIGQRKVMVAFILCCVLAVGGSGFYVWRSYAQSRTINSLEGDEHAHDDESIDPNLALDPDSIQNISVPLAKKAVVAITTYSSKDSFAKRLDRVRPHLASVSQFTGKSLPVILPISRSTSSSKGEVLYINWNEQDDRSIIVDVATKVTVTGSGGDKVLYQLYEVTLVDDEGVYKPSLIILSDNPVILRGDS